MVITDHLHRLLQRGVWTDTQNWLGHHVSHRQLQDHDSGSSLRILSVVPVLALDR